MTRHRYDCHVRFSDVDVFGHVNNVKYFEYYQEARIAFVRSLGRGEEEPPMGQVVARIDVDYKRPMLFRPEPYVIETWVTHIGTSSYGLSGQILDDDQVLSRADVRLVSFDVDANTARALSDAERARLESVAEL
jgi:acyl-CoA thioester hydrolase